MLTRREVALLFITHGTLGAVTPLSLQVELHSFTPTEAAYRSVITSHSIS
jgi:hypothetical protein